LLSKALSSASEAIVAGALNFVDALDAAENPSVERLTLHISRARIATAQRLILMPLHRDFDRLIVAWFQGWERFAHLAHRRSFHNHRPGALRRKNF
jgi:hypothetical protein